MAAEPAPAGVVTLFLCGDVMTGRGIDQILSRPSDPRLHEPYVTDAREYVALAEQANGPIPRHVDPDYIWGDALNEWVLMAPAARIVNLETSITTSADYWPGKGINYRMHPSNVGCLAVARIDVATLANNHVLDYDRSGLHDTLAALSAAGLKIAGAGGNLVEARTPARVRLEGKGELVVVALGSETSGIPMIWAAGDTTPGVALVGDLSTETAIAICRHVRPVKRPGTIIVASLHWGSNWGYEVPASHIDFAHALIDGGIDLVHGHSSHHVRPVEIYRERLILYGCGDFINDYEGISGHEAYRGDLAVMYFVTLEAATGAVVTLQMTPMQIRRFRLNRAAPTDAEWLRHTLDRISTPFGSRIDLSPDLRLTLAR